MKRLICKIFGHKKPPESCRELLPWFLYSMQTSVGERGMSDDGCQYCGYGGIGSHGCTEPPNEYGKEAGEPPRITGKKLLNDIREECGLERVGEPGAVIPEMREALADYAHEAWSGWMRYLFRLSAHNEGGSVTIPIESVRRWQRQSTTPYEDLPESEKESDRKEADKMLAIIEAQHTAELEKVRRDLKRISNLMDRFGGREKMGHTLELVDKIAKGEAPVAE